MTWLFLIDVLCMQNRPSVITCAPANNRNCNLSHCTVSHNGCLPSNYRRPSNCESTKVFIIFITWWQIVSLTQTRRWCLDIALLNGDVNKTTTSQIQTHPKLIKNISERDCAWHCVYTRILESSRQRECKRGVMGNKVWFLCWEPAVFLWAQCNLLQKGLCNRKAFLSSFLSFY